MRSTATSLRSTRIILAALIGFVPGSLAAQRTGENAIRSAEDAFGTSIGNETIGLYNPDNARGFSPFAAGNIRLEGLYFDAVTGFNSRLVRGSTIRVGIAALGYPFPAPSGIADFRLRIPGDNPAVSTVAGGSSWGWAYSEIDGQLPLRGDRLVLGGGFQVSRDKLLYGDFAQHAGAAAVLRWRPTETIELLPFWSGYVHRDEESEPRFSMAGPFLPRRIPRMTDIAQPWTSISANEANYGAILKFNTAGAWALTGGVMRSVYQSGVSFSDQYYGVTEDGQATGHRIIATPPRKFASTSGELRVTRIIHEGKRRHIFHLSVRGRERTRRYDGSDAVDLGPADIRDPVVFPDQPPFSFGSPSRDAIRQVSAGAGYEMRWTDVGELSLGVQKTNYRKTTRVPGREDTKLRDSPWLFNAGGAAYVNSSLAIYGGFTRGLEESPLPPDIAVNRGDAPPSIQTTQYDGGVRWTITPGTRLVAGLFNVERPYFGLDQSQFYRQLGQVSHRGAEISLTSAITKQFNVVAGAVLLGAQVESDAAAATAVGKRPFGSTGRTLLLNGEYRFPSIAGLSADIGVFSVGDRIANTANTLKVPPRTIVNLGARYEWKSGRVPMSARIQVTNLFNIYSWDLRGADTFFYNPPRQMTLRVTADF